MSLRTPLCDLLGIEHPILQAGMAGAAGPEPAAAGGKPGAAAAGTPAGGKQDSAGAAPRAASAGKPGAAALRPGSARCPRKHRRRAGAPSGRTAIWHGARLLLSLPEATWVGNEGPHR